MINCQQSSTIFLTCSKQPKGLLMCILQNCIKNILLHFNGLNCRFWYAWAAGPFLFMSAPICRVHSMLPALQQQRQPLFCSIFPQPPYKKNSIIPRVIRFGRDTRDQQFKKALHSWCAEYSSIPKRLCYVNHLGDEKVFPDSISILNIFTLTLHVFNWANIAIVWTYDKTLNTNKRL